MASMVSTITREYLDALPDDGLRHELIDGQIIMSPAPGSRHQLMVGGLFLALRAAFQPPDFAVLMAPFDVLLGGNVVEPDLLVAPRSAFTDRDLPVAPLLVVEVRSPSTARMDQGRKQEIYQEAGVRHYWLADPGRPALRILELMGGGFRETAYVAGNDALRIERPAVMSLVPTELARG
jgi:Uma2 family endonuclease